MSFNYNAKHYIRFKYSTTTGFLINARRWNHGVHLRTSAYFVLDIC